MKTRLCASNRKLKSQQAKSLENCKLSTLSDVSLNSLYLPAWYLLSITKAANLSTSAATLPFIIQRTRLHKLPNKGLWISTKPSNHNNLLQFGFPFNHCLESLSLTSNILFQYLLTLKSAIAILDNTQIVFNCKQVQSFIKNDPQPLLLHIS